MIQSCNFLSCFLNFSNVLIGRNSILELYYLSLNKKDLISLDFSLKSWGDQPNSMLEEIIDLKSPSIELSAKKIKLKIILCETVESDMFI